MLQQPGDELGTRHTDRALAAVVIGAHAQDHSVAVDGQQSLIADGGAMGVARQVVQHRGRPRQRRLGVDHPVVLPQGLRSHCAVLLGQCRIARQQAGSPGLLQGLKELASEDPGQGMHGEQEALRTLRSAPGSAAGLDLQGPTGASSVTTGTPRTLRTAETPGTPIQAQLPFAWALLHPWLWSWWPLTAASRTPSPAQSVEPTSTRPRCSLRGTVALRQ